MKQIIQIESMTKDELKKILVEALKPKEDPLIRKILNTTVDRAYVKRNLNISHRQVLKYEREGILMPIKYSQTESGSVYYRLCDVLKLMQLTRL